MLTRRELLYTGTASLLAGCGMRDYDTLRSADAHPAGYPTVEAVRFLGKDLARRTDGRLQLKVYPGGQLGEEKDTLEITVFGGLDLNRVSMAPLSNISPLVVVPSLPFLFNSEDHMRRAMDGAPGRRILDSLQPYGLVGLCFYDSGARSMYNSLRPIRTPADMQGLKIRVQNSDLFVAMMQALGANPTPMPYGEVYSALVQGVVDGAENNWPSFESSRHYEASRYYSLTRHVMVPEILLMSLHSWERLAPDDQQAVRDSAWASVGVMRKLWDAQVAESHARVLASGRVEVQEDVDIAAFQRALEPVWEQFLTTPELRSLAEEIRAMAG